MKKHHDKEDKAKQSKIVDGDSFKFKKSKHSHSKSKSIEEAKKESTAKDGTLTPINLESIEELLKDFDLNCDFGPIIGITRTDRFIRAERFNLPITSEIKNIFKDTELFRNNPQLDLNMWHNLEHIL